MTRGLEYDRFMTSMTNRRLRVTSVRECTFPRHGHVAPGQSKPGGPGLFPGVLNSAVKALGRE